MKFAHMMVIAAVTSCVFNTVRALRCNVCISSVSWDDCEKSQNTQRLTCESEDTYCHRHMTSSEVMGITIATFSKGCAISDNCTPEAIDRCKNAENTDLQAMPGVTAVECDLKCCQGDLCN
ncbi:uncharacterized protein LOC111327083 [Stylophora pistillata]|uniref:Uncharacterized protein n=1 Tax=Stylophora pistillata TaxID=50429 RepID=A0A2B4SHB6_STYPI|nr:uncharacterized protein LOC111327083 [Stylophora pistillata]PFX27872.1 hypothetical protein AWC38_SpisGene7440 [Stylophora pistillata]